MGVIVSPSPFHVGSATFLFKGGSLPHSLLLWQRCDPPTGDGSPWTSPISVGISCRQWFSVTHHSRAVLPQSQGLLWESLVPCCSVGSSTGCKWMFSPLAIPEDCKDSTCHLALGWWEKAAPVWPPLPTSLTWVSAWVISHVLLPYKAKRELPKQKVLPNMFPLLNIYYRDTDCLSLGQRRGPLEAGEAFWEVS